MKKFNNIDEIARDVIKQLVKEDVDILSGQMPIDYTAVYRMTICRWIRNTYGLWIDSPLTEVWRNNPETRKIIDGVDHSYYHPDAVSARVYALIEKHLSYYPGRKVKVNISEMSVADAARKFNNNPCVIVKQTKGGLIEVANAQYPKNRVTVYRDEIAFEGS